MSADSATWSADAARAVLDSVEGPGPVLRALQALQAAFGYVDPDAVPLVAQHFNVSRADVHGVLTFYSDLRTTPPASTLVRVCLGEACQSVGARPLLAHAKQAEQSDVAVGHVYCLGNCALGPAATVNGRLMGRVTPDLLTVEINRTRDSGTQP